MAVNEPERQDLYRGLQELMGDRRAETMMKLLPPTGWGDVATRRDLEAHQVATRRDLEAHQRATELALAAMKSDINAQIWRTALVVNLPTLLAAVGLTFAATRLG